MDHLPSPLLQEQIMSKVINTTCSVCIICDVGFQLRTEVANGEATRVVAHHNPTLAGTVYYKTITAADVHNHADRLKVALKRAGETGEDSWEEISNEQTMEEITERLGRVWAKPGSEALAVSTSDWNTQFTQSTDRRFMHLLDSPNWRSGFAMCAGIPQLLTS